MWNNTTGGIAETVWDTLDPKSEAYQAAGNWTGVLFAVQAIGSILWAMVLHQFKNVKFGYSFSLVLGAVGFISTYYIHDQYTLFVSFLLIGCAWAAMLAMPFALLTNSLSGKSMGSYLGLFNCTICLPQIVAALVGGILFTTFGGEEKTIVVETKSSDAKVVAVETSETPEEVAVEYVAETSDVEATDATEVAETAEEVAETAEEVAETTEEVAATDTATEETLVETKTVQSGQIIMLVIAGVSLLLGALAVFGINTRRKE